MDFLIWLQGFGNPVFDAFFLAVTRLGNEGFYLILLPFIYWNVDRRLGYRLTVLFLASIFTNFILKDALRLPRPEGPGLRVPEGAFTPGYGFPSGHAQGNMTVWAYLILRFRQRWLMWLGLGIVGLVSLSRLYLGVHYPIDVLGGLVIGLALVLLFSKAETLLEGYDLPVRVRFALAIVLPLAALLIHRSPDAFRLSGVLMGLSVGYIVHEQMGLTGQTQGLWRQMMKFILGLGLALIVRLVTSPFFPEGLGQVVRYLIVGLVISLAAPILFRALGLEERERGGWREASSRPPS